MRFQVGCKPKTYRYRLADFVRCARAVNVYSYRHKQKPAQKRCQEYENCDQDHGCLLLAESSCCSEIMK